MKAKLLTIATMAALLLAVTTTGNSQNEDAPCLPQEHGLLEHQSAMCGITQTTQLVAGWNWFSVAIEMDYPTAALAMLEDALGTNGVQIKARNGKYTEYDDEDEEWFGTLTSLTNEDMYLIEMSAACTVELQGAPANPANHPISIVPGWNWIGFPSGRNLDVETAFANFNAEEDDQLKSRNNGYTDFDGDEWFGTLSTLVPGQGYMYWSEGTGTKTLIISTGAKGRRAYPNFGNLPKPQLKEVTPTDGD